MKQPLSCVRCSTAHSTPHAFMLTCSGDCSKSWHHRKLYENAKGGNDLHCLLGCHQPPVSDSELIARIKAFNDGDIQNSIHGWMCRRCLKHHKASTLQNLSIAEPVPHLSPDSDLPSTRLHGNTSNVVETVNPPAPDLHITMTSTQAVPITNLYVKYNLAPSWMHDRHPNLQRALFSMHLTRKRTSRKVSASKNPPVAGQDPFNFSSLPWLRERQESLSSMRQVHLDNADH